MDSLRAQNRMSRGREGLGAKDQGLP